MKFKKFLALGCLTAGLVGTMAGCGSKVVEGGASVIQMRVYKGGYLTEWLHEVADAFMAQNPDIEIRFEEESSAVTEAIMNEISVPSKNNIDLYFSNGNHVADLITKSKSILKTSNQTLLEPLNDVFESKAIGYDGKEEDVTIKEKFFDGYEEAFTYNGLVEKWHGNMYALPWADAATGVFCNKSVLDKYNLDIPLTSNEFTACIETIASHTKADGIFPWSWAGNNCAGYWLYLYETWFAQYSGREGFNNFVKCDPGDGNIEQNGYKVYEDEGIHQALKAMEAILDLNYSANGSVNKMHLEAQNEFIRGKSAFMCDGEWLFQEMSKEYYEEAKEIIMVSAPILSVIGEEGGVSDAELHTIVADIDAGKTDAEIKADVAKATDALIERVRNARGVHDGIGVGHCIEVPSSSDAIPAVKKFLRYYFSNDGARSFYNKAHGSLPIKFTKKEGDVSTPFQDSVYKILNTGRPQMVSYDARLNDVRSVSQMYPFNVTSWQHPQTFKAIMLNKGVITADKIFNDEKAYMKTSWSKYMSYVF